MGNPFDDKPIRRVEIGPEDQPKLTPDQKAGYELAARAETAARLRQAEAIWRAVVDFSNGSSAPSSAPQPTAPAATVPAADTPVDWNGIDWGSGWGLDPDCFLY